MKKPKVRGQNSEGIPKAVLRRETLEKWKIIPSGNDFAFTVYFVDQNQASGQDFPGLRKGSCAPQPKGRPKL
jgi:hypothetical protein